MSRHSSARWLSMGGILGYNKARPRFPSLYDFFFLPSLISFFSHPLYFPLVHDISQPLSLYVSLVIRLSLVSLSATSTTTHLSPPSTTINGFASFAFFSVMCFLPVDRKPSLYPLVILYSKNQKLQ